MDFKYPPESFAVPPERFGRSPALAGDFDPALLTAPPTWGSPDDPDPARRAARVQEQVARFVRAHLKAQRLSQKQFAKLVGMDEPKVSRLLTGAVWASLTDLECLLGGCGQTLTSVALAIGDAAHQPPRVKKVIAAYLRAQLAQVEGETSHSEPGHPSTAGLRPTADPA